MNLKSFWDSIWGVITEPARDLKYNLEVERREGVSEPVYTLAKLFSENPERFKFEYTIYKSGHSAYIWCRDGAEAYCNISIRDSVTEEIFCIECTLNREAVKAHDDFNFYRSFAKHKYYPILGYSVNSKPSWITESEKDYLEAILKSYFSKRVTRYAEIVNYRKERKDESDKRKTELGKRKERERLTRIYKGE